MEKKTRMPSVIRPLPSPHASSSITCHAVILLSLQQATSVQRGSLLTRVPVSDGSVSWPLLRTGTHLFPSLPPLQPSYTLSPSLGRLAAGYQSLHLFSYLVPCRRGSSLLSLMTRTACQTLVVSQPGTNSAQNSKPNHSLSSYSGGWSEI